MVLSSVDRICVESHEDLHVLGVLRNDQFRNRLIIKSRNITLTLRKRVVAFVLNHRYQLLAQVQQAYRYDLFNSEMVKASSALLSGLYQSNRPFACFAVVQDHHGQESIQPELWHSASRFQQAVSWTNLSLARSFRVLGSRHLQQLAS
jgi:hypothetical protein